MSDEIDEFIRRAAERRKAQGSGQRKPQPQRPVAPPPTAPKERPRTLVPQDIVEAEVIEDVATHVNKHLDIREYAQRASQMAEETSLADDKLEARLHQTFDHKLGRLAQTTALTPTTSMNTEAAIVTLSASSDMLDTIGAALRSPLHVRQAVILSEIISRPEHRWE